MPITVRAPDGSLVQFPDGMSDSEISRVMRANYPPSGRSTAPTTPTQPRPTTDSRVARRQEELTAEERGANERLRRFQERQGQVEESSVYRTLQSINRFLGGESVSDRAAAGLREEAEDTADRVRRERAFIQREGRVAPTPTLGQRITGGLAAIPRGGIESAAQAFGQLGIIGEGGEAAARRAEATGRQLAENIGLGRSETGDFDPLQRGVESFGEGLGSLLPYLITEVAGRKLAPVTRAAPVIARGTQLMLGTGQGAAQARQQMDEYEQRTGERIDPATRRWVQAGGAAIGLSELLPVGRMVSSLPAPMRAAVNSRVTNIVTQTTAGRLTPDAARTAIRNTMADLERSAVGRVATRGFAPEALQEGGSQFAQNLLARTAYDPEQALMEDVPENALLGGLVGGTVRSSVEIANVLGNRAATNRAKAIEMAQNPPLTSYELAIPSREDPTQVTRERVDVLGAPDAEGLITVRRPDGSLRRMTPEDLTRMRVSADTAAIPETFSRTAVNERLVAALGANAEIDRNLSTYIGNINTRLNNAMATSDPAKVESYIAEEQKALKSAKIPQETKIARMLVLDEAQKVQNEYLDFLTAPSEAQAAAPTTAPTPPVEDRDILAEIAEAQQAQRQERAKRAELLDQAINSPDANKLEVFSTLMGAEGLSPDITETALIRDWLREESARETAEGQAKDVARKNAQIDRMNIVERVLFDDRIPLDKKVDRINAKLRNKGMKAITPSEMRTVYGYEAAEGTFGSEGEYQRIVEKRAAALAGIMSDPSIKDKYKAFMELADENGWVGPDDRELALMPLLRGDAAEIESQIPSADEKAARREARAQREARAKQPVAPITAPVAEASVAEAPVAEAPVAEAPVAQPAPVAEVPPEPVVAEGVPLGGVPEAAPTVEPVAEPDPLLDEQYAALAQELEQAQVGGEIDPQAYRLLSGATERRADITQIRDKLEEARTKTAEREMGNRYRGGEGGAGLSVDEVNEHVDKIVAKWKADVPVTVVESIDQLPDTLREAVIADSAQDAAGFVSPDGTVYLLSQNLSSLEDATATLYHEALGHLGLRSLFDQRLDKVLQGIYTSNKALRDAADTWVENNPGAYGDATNPKLRALEEVLAEQSEAGRVNASVWAKIKAVFKDFGRRMGIQSAYTDGDVRAILAMAHDKIINGDRESSVVKGLRYMVNAFHGSPHDFDKFSTESIGTGEGAQAYGWGLYFSSNKGIAQGYRDRLSKGRITIDTPDGPVSERDFNTAALVEYMGFPPVERGVQNPRYPAIYALDMLGGSKSAGYDISLDEVISEMREDYSHFPKKILDQAEAALRAANPRVSSKGKMYEVALDLDEEDMLDLDKPLYAQSQKVRDALENMGFVFEGVEELAEVQAKISELEEKHRDLLLRAREAKQQSEAQAFLDEARSIDAQLRPLYGRVYDLGYSVPRNGMAVYKGLEADFGSPKAASQALLLAGIRGNTYIGGNSGIRNYVVFGDSDVAITNKYSRNRIDAPALPGGRPPSPNRPLIETLGYATDMKGRVKRMGSAALRKFNYKYQDSVDYAKALGAVYGVNKLPDNMNVANKFALLESRKIGNQYSLKRWHLDPLEDKIKELQLDPKTVGLYLWARSAKDRNAMVLKRSEGETIDGSGMTDADAQAILDQFAIEGQIPALRQVAKLFDNMIDYIGKEKVKAGLLSQEEWAALRKAQPFYAPLKGFALDGEDMNEDGDPRTAMAEARGEYERQGGRTKIKEYLTVEGRKSMPFNPLFTAMSDAQFSIARIERNRVGQQLLDNALGDPDTHESVVKVYSEKKVPGATMLSGEALTTMRQRATGISEAANRVFVVKKDGQTYYLDFQNSDAGNGLYQAFSNMTPKELNAFYNGGSFKIPGTDRVINYPGLTNISNGLKSLKTRFNMTYLLGTAWQRDFQEAILTNLSAQGVKGGAAEGKKIAARSAKYMFDLSQATVIGTYLTSTDPDKALRTRLVAKLPGASLDGMEEMTMLFDQFLRDGGAVGQAMISNASDQVQAFNAALGVIAQMKKGRPDKAAAEFVGMGFDFLDAMSQIIDMQARFATYRAALDANISRENAALLALDSSLNLTRRGELAPILDAWFFFFSAGIEGGRKFINQGITSRNAKVLMGLSVKLGIILQLWNYFMGEDDDEDGRKNIYDVSDVTRQTRAVIYYGPGTNDYLQLPVAFSFGFSKYMGEQIAAMMLGDISPMEAAVTSANAFRNMALPVKGSASNDLMVNAFSIILPDATQPFIDAEANVNFFGSPIYRENKFSSEPPSGMGREDTPQIWKTIAETINDMGGSTYVAGPMSRQPEYYEYLASQFGAGMFNFGNDIASLLTADARGEQTVVQRIPIVKSFVGKGGEYAPMNNFYRNTDNMESLYELYNDTDMPYEEWESRWSNERREYPLQTSERLLEEYGIAQKELKALRKDMRDGVYENVEAYHRDTNEVYKRFNRVFNEVERQRRGQ